MALRCLRLSVLTMRRDWFTEAFGAAVADIRREIVEIGWFGRAEKPQSPSQFYGHDKDDAAERTRQAPEHEHGIDR
jgi:hypothetical protein